MALPRAVTAPDTAVARTVDVSQAAGTLDVVARYEGGQRLALDQIHKLLSFACDLTG